MKYSKSNGSLDIATPDPITGNRIDSIPLASIAFDAIVRASGSEFQFWVP